MRGMSDASQKLMLSILRELLIAAYPKPKKKQKELLVELGAALKEPSK